MLISRQSTSFGPVSVACALLLFAVAARGADRIETRDASKMMPVTLLDMLHSVTMSGVAISPNEQFVSVRSERASLASNTVKFLWRILRVADGAVVATAEGGQPDRSVAGGVFALGDAQWSADSRWLYFRELKRGKLELWRLGIDGSTEKMISDPSDIDGFTLDDKHQKVYYWIGPARKALRAAIQREGLAGDILQANGTQLLMKPLERNMPFRSGMTAVRIATAADGFSEYLPLGDDGARKRMVYELEARRSHAISVATHRYRHDDETDAVEPLPHVDGIGVVVSFARSVSSGDIAFVKYENIDARDVFRHRSRLVLGLKRAAGGGVEWCDDARCQGLTGQVVWRPKTSEFLFTRTTPSIGAAGNAAFDADSVTMYAWNERALTLRRVFHAKGKVGPGTSLYFPSHQCPITTRYAVCVVESAVEPPVLVRISLDNGAILKLFEPNSSLRKSILAAGISAHVRHMVWQDHRGLPHTGVFLSSRTSEPGGPASPLVITAQSCAGFLRGGTGHTAPEVVLWEQGFAVLCTNFDDANTAPAFHSRAVPRGSPTRNEYMFDGWRSAVQVLASKGFVDPHRIGISGTSFSAETVNWVITHHPGFAAAATAGHLSSVTEPMSFYEYEAIGGKLAEAGIQGNGLADPRTPQGMRQYRMVSDALNAGRVCTPLLVQTDEAEFSGGAFQYYAALRLDEAPAEVIVFPDESHLFWQPRNLLIAQERNIDWFRFWLQHYQSSNRAKSGRYDRWERIRAQWESVRHGRPGCGLAQ